VRAMSGRQIERCFRVTPDLADDYRGDAFWEHRAIAARRLPPGRLLRMMLDTDSAIRKTVAHRLPAESPLRMSRDSAPDVRAVARQGWQAARSVVPDG